MEGNECHNQYELKCFVTLFFSFFFKMFLDLKSHQRKSGEKNHAHFSHAL